MTEKRIQAPHHCYTKMPLYSSGLEESATHRIVKKICIEVPYNKVWSVWEFVAASPETASNDSNPPFYPSKESKSQDC